MNEKLVKLLRTPGGSIPVVLEKESCLTTATGEKYAIRDGVLCLIREAEMGRDLGDEKFYEDKPFGIRNWSDPEEVEAGVENEFKQLAVNTGKNDLIADIGCGSGRISNYLSMHGYKNVVSLDYSFTSVRMVKENSHNLCIWGNILDLPLASQAFDLVISTGVIHHTPDPQRAFAECARIIKLGGRFYVKLRNIHSPYGYLFKSYGAFLRFCEARRPLRWLSEIFGFGVYRLTRKLFYPNLPRRPKHELRGKYENLFIKKLITFFSTRQVKKMIASNGMEIEYGHKTSFTHRQHFYVARKPE